MTTRPTGNVMFSDPFLKYMLIKGTRTTPSTEQMELDKHKSDLQLLNNEQGF